MLSYMVLCCQSSGELTCWAYQKLGGGVLIMEPGKEPFGVPDVDIECPLGGTGGLQEARMRGKEGETKED